MLTLEQEINVLIRKILGSELGKTTEGDKP